MIHEGYLFDFPGRRYAFAAGERAGLRATLAALRAVMHVVEPVEIILSLGDERHRLATPDAARRYIVEPARERRTSRIDESAAMAWIGALATHDDVRIEIDAGWYAVDASPSDQLVLGSESGRFDVPIALHEGTPRVRDRSANMLVPPLSFVLDGEAGRIEVALHASPWVDVGGIGRARFERMQRALESSGWALDQAPAPASLAWREWARTAVPSPARIDTTIASADGRPAADVGLDFDWVALPQARVRLGLDQARAASLADALLVVDRAAYDDEQPLGFGPDYVVSERRARILAALAPSLGHVEQLVRDVMIMRRPVTNAMWRAYVHETGAAEPPSWSKGPFDPQAPVTSVSPRDAIAFAAHHGALLPSEAEWQLAATGLDEASIACAPSFGATGRFESPLGIQDAIAGGVELTRDVFAPYFGAPATTPLTAEGALCARGHAAGAPSCIAARRAIAPDARHSFVRFRCVRPVQSHSERASR